MSQVRIGIIGVGNCARALLEGISFYRASAETTGLMHPQIGPYAVGDIEPVVAFDVDATKVGRSIWDARTCGQNLDVGLTAGEPVAGDVAVLRGPTLDGTGERYRERILLADDRPDFDGAEIVGQLREAQVEVLLNYLPVGSQDATEWWARTAIEAGCAFVNNIPVFIARRTYWQDAFRGAGLPLIGDDIKSQYGATYIHRLLARACSDRGVTLDRTYQLNVGGNMDFYNMLEQSRLASKRESKSSAVMDSYAGSLNPANVHIGPSDYVHWLGDTKRAFVRCEARGWGGAAISLDLNLTVPDSPNSAGVVADAARLAKLAMDRGDTRADESISAWLFKAPPRAVASLTDGEAHDLLESWLGEPAAVA